MKAPADIGEGPAFQPSLLAPRHWLSWIGIGVIAAARLLPTPLRDAVAGLVGTFQYRNNPKRRGIVELNLARCYPELDEGQRNALARDHFRAYARVMADQARLWLDLRRRVPGRDCRVEGLEYIEAERARGRSVILLEPHSVAVELGGIALTPHVELSTVANRLSDPVLHWLVNHVRRRYGVRVWFREDGLRPVVRALRKGTVFYYMPDEDQGERDAVFAPFFGEPKATLNTLGRLARLSGAAVIPTMAWYDEDRRCYRVRLQPPLRGFPTGDAIADATAMNKALEQSIALCPEQYLWNYRLFRTQPDGSRMPYPSHEGWRRSLRRRRRRHEKMRR